MTLHSRASKIIDDFNFFNSWEEKYEHIINLGKSLPELNESLKTDAALIRGCQSKVWIVCKYSLGKLYFYGDSDASLSP